jgi:hypothetical protein
MNEISKLKGPMITCLLILAVTIALSFARFKSETIKIDQGVLDKKLAAISCGSYRSFQAGQLTVQEMSGRNWNQHNAMNLTDPSDKNNKNNCSHQQGGSALCETSRSKRRVINVHSC